MLVLLPTDQHKLFMQWRGPFEVSSVVGLSDYNVKVIGKEKVYHSSLRKNVFWARGDYSVDAVDCAAKVDEAEGEEVNFLELGEYIAKESIEDVAIGPNLTDEQRTEFDDLAKQFSNFSTEAPGTTDLVQHHIKLTSDESVRS